MNNETFRSILSVGETVAVEFKRCGNGIEHDTYESVCSFLNRFGGDPQFREGDVFRIIVPLNEAYSYDYELGQEHSDTIDTILTRDLVLRNLSTDESVVLELITKDAALTQKQVQNITGYSLSTVKRIMVRLQKKVLLLVLGITALGNGR